MFGRRKTDGWAQRIIWAQILMMLGLYLANVVQLVRVSVSIGTLQSETEKMRDLNRIFLESLKGLGIVR